MKAPLYDAVKAHNKKNMVSMHMPAHKGVAEPLAALSEMQTLDVTEIPDTGSLFDGEGATAQAEVFASELFGTAATFMSAGGCTLCIQAMLRAVAPHGGKVVCGRVVHRSAINAMALLGIEPVWILPDDSAGEAFSGRITPQAVCDALTANPDACAVYITSPDYFGVMSDIKGIAEVAKQHGVPLIVDNAHGAHLKFLKEDMSPTSLGAAMSADSAHKTLPVMTGGAWLQVCDSRFVPDIRQAMALFGSTSPSYPIMISLDLARAFLCENGREQIEVLVGRVNKIKDLCAEMGLAVAQGICDPARIAFDTSMLGFSDGEFGELLRLNGVEPEYAGQGKVILIPSVMNTQEDFDVLSRAIEKICNEKREPAQSVLVRAALPQKVISPREALLSQSESVPVEKSVGRVAAEVFCPCPPAIPVVMPGEKIGKNEVSQLLSYGIFNIKVVK
ncbi:MAG: aminotransferase class I/II-fold pyridoxal phosphate-dependent enzyme [Clostridia bacterium]|nr:aminotransferase class I/II-fold pyridoxal phosphate-dependent enzyme [Clostridia bacterium]